MPVGYYGPPTSGLEAFTSGVSSGFGGVTDFLRKRQEQQMADKDRQRKIQNDVWDQDRKNIEAGIGPASVGSQPAGAPSVAMDPQGNSDSAVTPPGHWAPLQQGVRSDAVTQARQQVGGIRAAIGGILSRFNAPADAEVTHLTKTGPSSREVELGITESGANSRNAASEAGANSRNAASLSAQATESAARLAAERRGQDLTHQDRQAEIGVQRASAGRQSQAMDLQADRDYASSIDREMDNIRAELTSKQAIMQHADPKNGDIMKGYQTWTRTQQSRLMDLRKERDDIALKMRGRSVGNALAAPPASVASVSHGGGSSF